MIRCRKCLMGFSVSNSSSGEFTRCAVDKCEVRFSHTAYRNDPRAARVWVNANNAALLLLVYNAVDIPA